MESKLRYFINLKKFNLCQRKRQVDLNDEKFLCTEGAYRKNFFIGLRGIFKAIRSLYDIAEYNVTYLESLYPKKLSFGDL